VTFSSSSSTSNSHYAYHKRSQSGASWEQCVLTYNPPSQQKLKKDNFRTHFENKLENTGTSAFEPGFSA